MHDIARVQAARLVKDGADVLVAPDGLFVVGFGRDHASIAIIITKRRLFAQ